jgi:hypothetical protein
MAKISTFVISLIIFTIFIVGGITPFLAELNSKYPSTDYNVTRLEAYNKLNEIQTNAQEVQEKATELQSKSGDIDVLGGFFQSGYSALKISLSSFSLFNTMANQVAEDSGLPYSSVFVTGLILIVLIIIFLGIIISTVVKREV